MISTISFFTSSMPLMSSQAMKSGAFLSMRTWKVWGGGVEA